MHVLSNYCNKLPANIILLHGTCQIQILDKISQIKALAKKNGYNNTVSSSTKESKFSWEGALGTQQMSLFAKKELIKINIHVDSLSLCSKLPDILPLVTNKIILLVTGKIKPALLSL